MPLRNISQNEINVKYNGIEKTVHPGKDLDVRDFDIQSKQIPGVETFLLDKHGRDKFKQVEAKEKSLEKENADLRKQLAQANAKIDELEKLLDDASAPQKTKK